MFLNNEFREGLREYIKISYVCAAKSDEVDRNSGCETENLHVDIQKRAEYAFSPSNKCVCDHGLFGHSVCNHQCVSGEVLIWIHCKNMLCEEDKLEWKIFNFISSPVISV